MVTANSTGRSIGSTTRHKIVQVPAPMFFAASIVCWSTLASAAETKSMWLVVVASVMVNRTAQKPVNQSGPNPGRRRTRTPVTIPFSP